MSVTLSPMATLTRWSRVMAGFALTLMLCLPVLHGWHWLNTPAPILLASYGVAPALLPAGYALDGVQTLRAAVVSGTLVAAMMWSLLAARQAFRQLAAGRVFAAETIAAVHRFALGVLLTTIVAIVQPPLMSWLLTLHLADEQRRIVAHLSTGHLFMLVVAGLFWAMTALMRRGAELAAENAEFV